VAVAEGVGDDDVCAGGDGDVATCTNNVEKKK
jgi:hypothetical protein